MELRILHLEDCVEDALLIKRTLVDAGVSSDVQLSHNREEFAEQLKTSPPDIILAGGGAGGFNGMDALQLATKHCPHACVIFVNGSTDRQAIDAALAAGAQDYLCRTEHGRLVRAVRGAADRWQLGRANRGMLRLVEAVQELSLARDLGSIMTVVRSTARQMTNADGATFVLRDGDCCYYAEEDAISPLWKGQRFPMSQCISGWVMLNRQSAVIEDIYADLRIPAAAYRPTFVKSLAMVPIRTESPIGAIGIYWAKRRRPTAQDVELLQALANTTSVAMENVRVYEELERRVEQRTAQLAMANEELESFAYAVSHDLGAPLRCIRGYSELLLRECPKDVSETGRLYLERVQLGTQQMRDLMDDLLRLSRVTQTDMRIQKVNLAELAREKIAELREASPDRAVTVNIADGMEVQGDTGLLRIAMDNLLSNAWKFTLRAKDPTVTFGAVPLADGRREFFVRDNGAGFDMRYADKLFRPFRRLHTQDEFPGSGIGLCTVKRVVQRHGGVIHAEGALGRGATFYFTLGS